MLSATQVRLYDATTGREQIRLQKHGGMISRLAFSPDGRFVASAGWDNTVRIANVATQAEMVLRGHRDAVWSVAYSPDGIYIASSSLDGTVKIWDAATGNEVTTLRGHLYPVYWVAFSPDGGRLASGAGAWVVVSAEYGKVSHPGEIKVWDKKLWDKK